MHGPIFILESDGKDSRVNRSAHGIILSCKQALSSKQLPWGKKEKKEKTRPLVSCYMACICEKERRNLAKKKDWFGYLEELGTAENL